MKQEELTNEQETWFVDLKHGSHTIECDVNDALLCAKDVAEFKSLAVEYLEKLISETQGVINEIQSRF